MENGNKCGKMDAMAYQGENSSMKNNVLFYSVGALLYCPANKATIADSVIRGEFGSGYSLALCLEDTIGDGHVAEAERLLIRSLESLRQARQQSSFYLPQIFIRVRNPEQIDRLMSAVGAAAELVRGFIIPKFSPDNAGGYIQEIIRANERSAKPVYMMPIYENAAMIDLRGRADFLYSLKASLKEIEDRVLTIRVGGNDLCHRFGFRRHADESIHRIRPIANLFSDIITVYGEDYVISGPVWEYYAGESWAAGLAQEIADDRLCGFIGKTVIHPNQISVVNEAYRVAKADYNDALSIVNWKQDAASLVSGSTAHERMNEYKTHLNWAQKTLYLAEVFGVAD